jgi:nitrate/nitrite transport system substrate-binding protein
MRQGRSSLVQEEAMPDFEQRVERALEYAVFGGAVGRREFVRRVGAGTAAAALASVFPMAAAKALAQDKAGPLEKKDLKIGFIPITCATPIIMAEPMGFYKKHGLNAQVVKASSWAMIRDLSINGETDATHMLSPMPLAISMGVGSQSVPYVMPAVENINGQAITLAIKHKGVKSAAEMKGFKFGVPFDYSMHNFLLRYVLAEGGVDPDKDVQIRAVPPPEMVANLRAGNLDGYLGPDPFNQRAVFEEVGFIWMLSKDIWPGHPCCAFAAKREFAEKAPNTFRALLQAIVDATQYAHDNTHRKEIAKAIAPRNYLNQPVEVIEQVLTGVYPDGLGQTKTVPDRIDFDPFPYQSMAIWILTQMKRWGYVKTDVNYRKVAEEVFLATACRDAMRAVGAKAPDANSIKHTFALGKTKLFDPDKPDDYLKSFPIRRA